MLIEITKANVNR